MVSWSFCFSRQMVSQQLHGRGSVSEGYVSEAKMTNVTKIARVRDPHFLAYVTNVAFLGIMICSERGAECARWLYHRWKGF